VSSVKSVVKPQFPTMPELIQMLADLTITRLDLATQMNINTSSWIGNVSFVEGRTTDFTDITD